MPADRPDIDAVAIAAAVVFYLPGWSLKPRSPDDDNSYDRNRRAELVREDGHEIHLAGYPYERKLNIYGHFVDPYRPHAMYGSHDPNKPITDIGVNPTRPAKAIAADIAARLLPGCEVAWAEAATRKARDDANKDRTRAYVRQLAEALGERDPTIPRDHDWRNRQDSYRTYEEWHVGPFKLSSYSPPGSDHGVTIHRDHSVTHAQALKIAAILRPKPEGSNGLDQGTATDAAARRRVAADRSTGARQQLRAPRRAAQPRRRG